MNRQGELDYLRGAACIMVVLFHFLYRGQLANWTGTAVYPDLAPIAKYGYLGVHLFFMISGYVIYKSAMGRSAKEFAIARFWRLFPAYWAAILITTTFVWVFNAEHFKLPWHHVIFNFSMIHGLFNIASVDGAYWSLVVEFVFYVYVAVGIKVGVIKKTYLLAALWLSVSVINLIINSHWINTLLIAEWAPFFVIGVMTFKLREGDRRLLSMSLIIVALSLACYQSIYLQTKAGATREFEWMIIIAITMSFVATVGRQRKNSHSKISSAFGDLTYPVYLLHENIGFILLAVLSQFLDSWTSLFLVVLIVFAIGLLLHKTVEVRATKWLRS